MLLTHPWLTSLTKPAAIIEEDEDEDEAASDAVVPGEHTPSSEGESPTIQLPDNVVDAEVAEWVIQQIQKRKAGKLGKSEKPALHAAPLDAVTSPAAERTMLNGDEQVSASQPPAEPTLDGDDEAAKDDATPEN